MYVFTIMLLVRGPCATSHLLVLFVLNAKKIDSDHLIEYFQKALKFINGCKANNDTLNTQKIVMTADN